MNGYEKEVKKVVTQFENVTQKTQFWQPRSPAAKAMRSAFARLFAGTKRFACRESRTSSGSGQTR